MSVYTVTVTSRQSGQTCLVYSSYTNAKAAYEKFSIEGSRDTPLESSDDYGKIFSINPDDISSVTFSDVEKELSGINAVKLLQVRYEVILKSDAKKDTVISQAVNNEKSAMMFNRSPIIGAGRQ